MVAGRKWKRKEEMWEDDTIYVKQEHEWKRSLLTWKVSPSVGSMEGLPQVENFKWQIFTPLLNYSVDFFYCDRSGWYTSASFFIVNFCHCSLKFSSLIGVCFIWFSDCDLQWTLSLIVKKRIQLMWLTGYNDYIKRCFPALSSSVSRGAMSVWCKIG